MISPSKSIDCAKLHPRLLIVLNEVVAPCAEIGKQYHANQKAWIEEKKMDKLVREALWKRVREMKEKVNAVEEILPKTFREALRYEENNRALKALHSAGEIIYHSPDQMNEVFTRLGTPPTKESLHTAKLLVAKLNVEEVKKISSQLRDATEPEIDSNGNILKDTKGQILRKPPLLMVHFKALYAGEQKILPLNMRNLDIDNKNGFYPIWKGKWDRMESKKDQKGRRYRRVRFRANENDISAEILEKDFSKYVTVYTSAPLEGSRDKTFAEQKNHVKKKLGEGFDINADMYITMIVHYLCTNELLLFTKIEGGIRLHQLGIDNHPMHVSCRAFVRRVVFSDPLVKLQTTDTGASVRVGIGASFQFVSTLPTSQY